MSEAPSLSLCPARCAVLPFPLSAVRALDAGSRNLATKSTMDGVGDRFSAWCRRLGQRFPSDLLHRHRSPPPEYNPPDGTPILHLLRLPPELIEEIALFLPPLSQRALSMTCKLCQWAVVGLDPRYTIMYDSDENKEGDKSLALRIIHYVEKLGSLYPSKEGLGQILGLDLTLRNLSEVTIIDTNYVFSTLEILNLRINSGEDAFADFAMVFFHNIHFPSLTHFTLSDKSTQMKELDRDEYDSIKYFIIHHSDTLVTFELPLRWGVASSVDHFNLPYKNRAIKKLKAHQSLLVRMSDQYPSLFPCVQELTTHGEAFVWKNISKDHNETQMYLPMIQYLRILRITVEDRGMVNYQNLCEMYPRMEQLYITVSSYAASLPAILSIVCESKHNNFKGPKFLRLISLLVVEGENSTVAGITQLKITRNVSGAIECFERSEHKLSPYNLLAYHGVSA